MNDTFFFSAPQLKRGPLGGMLETIDTTGRAFARRRLAIRCGVGALWLLGVALAISSGWEPGYWWDRNRPWPYPFGHVLVAIVQISLVSLALYDFLRPRSEGSSLARTARAAGVSFLTMAWLAMESFTDQPGYAYAAWQYVTIVTAVLLVALVAHATIWAFRAITRRGHAA